MTTTVTALLVLIGICSLAVGVRFALDSDREGNALLTQVALVAAFVTMIAFNMQDGVTTPIRLLGDVVLLICVLVGLQLGRGYKRR